MLAAAPENGVSQVEEGAGRFPQVSGLRFVWDPAAEPGSRVVSAEVDMGGTWEALDPRSDLRRGVQQLHAQRRRRLFRLRTGRDERL